MPQQILSAFSSKMPETITRITMLGIEKRSRSFHAGEDSTLDSIGPGTKARILQIP